MNPSRFEWHSLPCARPQLDRSTGLTGLPLLFFFIVFYNNNSYQRYFLLYSHTVGMGAKTMEWTALVKANSRADESWARWNAVRPVLASMNILYYSLFGGDSDRGAIEPGLTQ